jgi:hypothetical protein
VNQAGCHRLRSYFLSCSNKKRGRFLSFDNLADDNPVHGESVFDLSDLFLQPIDHRTVKLIVVGWYGDTFLFQKLIALGLFTCTAIRS